MNMTVKNIHWAPLSASSSRAKPSEVRLSIHSARTVSHGANSTPRLDISFSPDIAQRLGLYPTSVAEARHAAVYCADGMLLICKKEDGARITGQAPESVYKVGRRSSTSPNSALSFACVLPPFCVPDARKAATSEHRIEDGALIIHVPKEFLLASVAPVALAPEAVPQPATEEHRPAARLPLPFDSTRLPDAPGLIVLDLKTESAPPPPHEIADMAERLAPRAEESALVLEAREEGDGTQSEASDEPTVDIPATCGATAPVDPMAAPQDEVPAVSGQPGAASASALSSAATRVLKVLTDCAATGKPCPTNRELSDHAECTEKDASVSLNVLDTAGLIRRIYVDRNGAERPAYSKGRVRIVEVVATGQKTANPFTIPTPPEKPTGGGASAPKPVVEQPAQEEPGRPTVATIAAPRPAKSVPVSKPRGRTGELSDAEREALEIVNATAAPKGPPVHGQSVLDAAISWLRSIRHVVRTDGAGGYRVDNKPKTGDELVEFANQRRAARRLPSFGAGDATAGRVA